MFSKRATVAALVLAMVAVLSSGLIYATFNDTETSNGNSFTAGTLDLKVNSVDNPTSTFTVGNVVPGSADKTSVTLTNSGSIAGTLTVAVTSVTNTGGTNPEPEQVAEATDTGDLGANMVVTIWVDSDGDGIMDATETTLYSNTLTAAVGPFTVTTLAAGEATHIGISYSVASTVGNVIQGDVCTFSIQYTLTQA